MAVFGGGAIIKRLLEGTLLETEDTVKTLLEDILSCQFDFFVCFISALSFASKVSPKGKVERGFSQGRIKEGRVSCIIHTS